MSPSTRASARRNGWVAPAEDRPRVRDPEAIAPRVLEALEVVEVGAVVDQLDGTARREPASPRPPRAPRRRRRPRTGATSRATYFSPRTSWRRCGCEIRESRRSATQRARGALHRSAEKVHRPGGDDVMTSMPWRRTSRIAAGTAVRSQGELGSGTRRRLAVRAACRRRRATPWACLSSTWGRWTRGPRFQVSWTIAAGGTRESSRASAWRPRAPGRASRCRARQVRRHLERPRRAAAAHGRPVHRREEDLHEPSIRKRV